MLRSSSNSARAADVVAAGRTSFCSPFDDRGSGAAGSWDPVEQQHGRTSFLRPQHARNVVAGFEQQQPQSHCFARQRDTFEPQAPAVGIHPASATTAANSAAIRRCCANEFMRFSDIRKS